MVYSRHTFLERLPNRHLVLRSAEGGHRFQFAPEQVRLYSRFDGQLRAGHATGAGLLTPAGYDHFRILWAQDEDCPYQFCEYDGTTGAITVHGSAIAIEELAPVVPRVPPREPVSTPAMPQDEPRYDARRQAIVDDLIFDQLDRSRKATNAIRARREARRSRETTPYAGSDRPSPKRALPRTKKKSLTNVAGPSEPRKAVPMDIDAEARRPDVGTSTTVSPAAGSLTRQDAEADEDDELVEYSSDDDDMPLAKGKSASKD
ncbi:hypothetical protein PYCCODRAFT_1193157 [Trametes coccinea BRFM310]|uniref:Uncharacterized protein n=1 Tax=Trametes coccinea (strain BRFM310) TaxID=1353009 RepID=A0A1Y2IB20_TRAC3|nr:hypothetical protein PYCCODRAFT_1193157 [Trametes coccinea BRFM310]